MDDPSDYVQSLTIVRYFFIAIATLTTAIRIYVRVFQLHSFKWDDVFIILGLGCLIAGMVIQSLIENGLTRLARLALENAPGFGIQLFKQGPIIAKLAFSTSPIYTWSIGFVKLSLLAFFLRFITMNPIYTRVIYASLAFITSYTIVLSMLMIFCCTEGHGGVIWKTHPYCNPSFNVWQMHFACGAFNLFTDLLVITLPIPTILKLRVSSEKKLSLLAVFSLGGFGCVATIARMVYLEKWRGSGQNLPDQTRAASMSSVWSVLEISMGIICANLPAIWTFSQQIWKSSNRSTWNLNTTNSIQDASKYSLPFFSNNNMGSRKNDLESESDGAAKAMTTLQ